MKPKQTKVNSIFSLRQNLQHTYNGKVQAFKKKKKKENALKCPPSFQTSNGNISR
jgi:hypothetical protein